MGLFGRRKKKDESEAPANRDNEGDASLDLIGGDSDNMGLLGMSAEASSPPSLSEALGLDLADDSGVEVQADEEEADVSAGAEDDDDDPLSGELMDIFAEEDGLDQTYSVFERYLEDVDMESVLGLAREVSSRLRGRRG